MKCWTRRVEAARIEASVQQLGRRIADEHEGEAITLIGLLRGGLFFLADLARAIPAPVQIETVQPQSWGGGMQSSGAVRFEPAMELNLRDRRVMLVDDIYDSGRTLRRVWDWAEAQRPRSLAAACLLVKDTKRAAAEVEIRHRGFDIPNVFVVGCGLDWNGLGRNLRDVWALEAGASEETAGAELLAKLRGGGKAE